MNKDSIFAERHYIRKALLHSIEFHRKQILTYLEPRTTRENWLSTRKMILDHLGDRGIAGQINDILAPRSFSPQRDEVKS